MNGSVIVYQKGGIKNVQQLGDYVTVAIKHLAPK